MSTARHSRDRLERQHVAVASLGQAAGAISTRMGSVRLTERLVAHDPPMPEDVAALANTSQAVQANIDLANSWPILKPHVGI